MKTLTFTLTTDHVKVVFAALGEIPTKLGMPVSLEINRQVVEQQREPDKPDKHVNGSGDEASAH